MRFGTLEIEQPSDAMDEFHPTAENLLEYLNGTGDDYIAENIRTHVFECDACAETLAVSAATLAGGRYCHRVGRSFPVLVRTQTKPTPFS